MTPLLSLNARQNSIALTGNVREFKRVPGLSLEEWAEVEL